MPFGIPCHLAIQSKRAAVSLLAVPVLPPYLYNSSSAITIPAATPAKPSQPFVPPPSARGAPFLPLGHVYLLPKPSSVAHFSQQLAPADRLSDRSNVHSGTRPGCLHLPHPAPPYSILHHSHPHPTPSCTAPPSCTFLHHPAPSAPETKPPAWRGFSSLCLGRTTPTGANRRRSRPRRPWARGRIWH